MRHAAAAAKAAVAAAADGKGGAAAEPEYEAYDWQRAAETSGASGAQGSAKPAASVGADEPLYIDDIPDLPDFDEAEDSGTSSIGAKVSERELVPDLPMDADLMPPGPNPAMQSGFGLLEWTGIWLGILLVVAGLGAAGSYLLAQVNLDPAFADTLFNVVKFFCALFQFLFLLRILLTQFPKIDTTEMPWAIVHYPTEWVLSPTRTVFKPEAGVDVAPILWLSVVALVNELVTGPSGILQLAREAVRDAPRGIR